LLAGLAWRAITRGASPIGAFCIFCDAGP